MTVKQVADKLSKRVPEEISILIDIEGRWASELELDTSRPNLLILDGQGRLVDRFRGRHGPELFEQVCAAIDALGAEG